MDRSFHQIEQAAWSERAEYYDRLFASVTLQAVPPILDSLGTLEGRRVAIQARHGVGHHISPGEINYRANIFALKSLNVQRIVSISACGSLKEEFAPGHIVIPDQLFDNTRERARTFFADGLVAHVSVADPFCPDLSAVLYESAATAGATIIFLVARSSFGTFLAEKAGARAKAFAEGFRRDAFNYLLFLRLVPLFPFNAQNYVYGLTKIPLVTYVAVSFVCMLPGCLAFNFAAGSVRAGQFGRFFLYMALAGVLFVLLSLIPVWIRRRYADTAAFKQP